MAERGTINELYDLQALEAQHKDAVGLINDFLAKVEKVNSAEKFGGSQTSAKGISSAMKENEAAAKQLATATQTVTDRIAKLNGSTKEFTDTLLKQAKAEKELSSARLNDAKASSEAAKAAAANAKSSKDAEAAKKREQKAVEDATNDYLQLSRAYNEASLKAKNYVLRLGENHPIAVQAVKDANDLGNVLKKLDASVGQNQRNVGNYSSAFNGLGFSFTQVARELPSLAVNFQQFALAISNNLPYVVDQIGQTKKEIAALRAEGKLAPSLFSQISKSIFSLQVGLSVGITLFTLYSKKIAEFFSNIFKSIGAVDQLRRQQSLLNEVQREAAKSAGDEIAKLQVLYHVATDTTLSIKERKKAVDELQEQYPEHFKNIDDEIILQGQAAAAYENVKNKIIEVARAKAIEAKIGKLANDELEKELDRDETLRKIEQNRLDKIKADKVDSRDSETRGLDQFAAISTGTTLNKKLSDLNTGLAQIASDREFLLSKITTAGTDDTTGGKGGADKDDKDLSEQRRRALFEIAKREQGIIAETNQAIFEDEKNSFLDRLHALDDYQKAKRNIIDLEAGFEKGKKGLTTEEILNIESDRHKKEIDLSREAVKLLNKIEFDDRLTEARAHSKKRLDEVKKEINEEIKLREALIGAGAKIGQTFADNVEKAAKDRVDILKKYAEEERALYHNLYDELSELATDFFTAQQDRQINQLQEEIDMIDRRKQSEIEVVNQTVTDRARAADEIAIIEARAQAQREQLQARQREVEKKKANIEKLGQAATIIGNTVQGIVNLNIKATEAQAIAGVLASNPATAPFAPNALLQANLIRAQIPFIIGFGAAQLARLALPRYAEGTEDHIGGKAIVGDGGKSELIRTPDGELMKTPSVPTVVDLPKHSVVYPDYDAAINSIMRGQLSASTTKPPVYGNAEVVDSIKSMEQKVVGAIKGKKELNLNASGDGLTAIWKWGANSVKYLNDQTNW